MQTKILDAPAATIGGIRIDALRFDEVVEHIIAQVRRNEPMHFIVTPNAHHLVMLQNDERFRTIYDRAFLVVPDGVPLLWAARLLRQPLNGRVNGTDLFEALCAASEKHRFRVFLLGGRTGAADAAAQRLQERHPELEICGTYCPPFGFENDTEECRTIVERINSVRPDLLFVGLGAPKQEYWMDRHRDEIDARVALGIGVSFEFVGGVVARAPRWMQVTGLEWLFRLMCEPKRMWKRYIIGNARFCAIIARERLAMRNAAVR